MDEAEDMLKCLKIAEAAEIFYKAQGLFEKAQEAQELKLRCLRQAGTILLPPEQGGNTVREDGKRGDLTSLGNLTRFQEVLKEGGISENTAFVWQKVARVPEDKFEVYFTEADYYKDEFTIDGLLKSAGKGRKRARPGPAGRNGGETEIVDRVLDNVFENKEDPLKAMGPLMNVFMKDFLGRKVKKH